MQLVATVFSVITMFGFVQLVVIASSSSTSFHCDRQNIKHWLEEEFGVRWSLVPTVVGVKVSLP
jgi:hypothetical protein